MGIFRELYGAAILFFYYLKPFVIIGYPVLITQLGYSRSTPADILWLVCVALLIKDIIYKFVLKKSHCDSCKR